MANPDTNISPKGYKGWESNQESDTYTCRDSG
jgi:hypothetical protein